jgi:hypothetical protein
MNKNLSDKGNGHHNYTKLYHSLFNKRRLEPLNILEIGIGSVNPQIPSNMTGGDLGLIYKPGASMRGWLDYFPNAKLYACDIDKDIINFDNTRITGFYMDQTNEIQVKQLVEGGILKDVKFDIIIDDGLHYFPVNYNVMKILLPLVNKDGYYIIEDIINTDYDPRLVNPSDLENTQYQYVTLPNPHNMVDNNLFIVSV